jgi:DNA helicase-2/ATP-dependent DNA helicase PcrA
VAITRAKHKLWLTYANARYRFGQLQQNDSSRFLEEIPEAHLDKSYAGGGTKNGGNSGTAFERMNRGFGGGNAWGGTSSAAAQAEKRYGAPPGKPATPGYLAPKPANKTVEHNPSPDFVASDTSNLQAGQKVEHQKFGFGEVMKMEGAAHNPIATVNFELNGEKKIMLNYAKLRIVE